MHVFDEMQIVSHCYTVVSYQAIFKHSIHKKSAVYHSSARVAFLFCLVVFFFFFFFLLFFFFVFFVVVFFKIREFGSPTIRY